MWIGPSWKGPSGKGHSQDTFRMRAATSTLSHASSHTEYRPIGIYCSGTTRNRTRLRKVLNTPTLSRAEASGMILAGPYKSCSHAISRKTSTGPAKRCCGSHQRLWEAGRTSRSRTTRLTSAVASRNPETSSHVLFDPTEKILRLRAARSDPFRESPTDHVAAAIPLPRSRVGLWRARTRVAT